MARSSIPVDLFNPGQVFACMGYLELLHALTGSATGVFSIRNGKASFVLEAACDENPFGLAFEFLCSDSTRVIWLSPETTMEERDGGETEIVTGVSLSRLPESAYLPGKLLGVFRNKEYKIPFGYWADGSGRFSVTFKKSTNGASSHVRFENGLNAIRSLPKALSEADPMNVASRTKSLFRLDPRGTVDPIHAGTSPDKLRKGGFDVRVVTYPLCELMAIFGLENARPKSFRVGQKNVFSYAVWLTESETISDNDLLPIELARIVIGIGANPWRGMRFLVYHEEVKKGGDRRVTQIVQESK